MKMDVYMKFNRAKVLEFLNDHSIILPDELISDEEKNLYDYLFEFLNCNNVDDCIPIIVNSFRTDSSAYYSEVFSKILSIQNRDIVINEIISSIRSLDEIRQESALFFAVEVASDEFIEPIIEVLRSDKTQDKIADMAIDVLESINTPSILENIDELIEPKYKRKKKEKQGQNKKKKTNADIDRIIEIEFRQNKRWENLVRIRAEEEFKNHLIRLNWQAKKALKSKNYEEVIGLLDEYDGKLPKIAQQKLDIAKSHVNTGNRS